MKSKRRDFLKPTGIAALGPAGSDYMKDYLSETDYAYPKGIEKRWQKMENSKSQRFNMSGFAAPPTDKVRPGIIGMGQRGPSQMITMSHVENVEIRALCD